MTFRSHTFTKSFLALTLLFSGIATPVIAPPKVSAVAQTKAQPIKNVAQPANKQTVTVAKTAYVRSLPQQGIVSVSLPAMKKGNQGFVVIEKGKQSYSFRIKKTESIPLPFGNGVYQATLYQGDGKYFQLIENKTFYANFTPLTFAKQRTILSPGIQDAQVKKLMQTQFKDWKKWSVEKRVANVHGYITKSFSYDYPLADNMETWFLPDMNRLMKKRQGICYDMASLTSSLLREMGVPTRVVMGYPKNVNIYHSWNEVYINQKWQVVDTTFDLGKKVKSPYKTFSNYSNVSYRF